MASFIGSILYLFTLMMSHNVRGEDFLLPGLPTQDHCANICTENSYLLPKLDLINYDQVVCQRGCRFFNIDSFKDALDLNVTKKECYLSCEESYIVKKETGICKIGCDLMMKKRENEVAAFLIFAEPDNSNNMMLIESDLEMLENDLMSDPSIRSQIEIGLNIAYKIPEAHIRTMPLKNIDTDMQAAFIIKTHKNTGDWLDCASRNSGVPRWVLLIAILSAVLVALWLSFSTEKKSNEYSDTNNLIEDEYEPTKSPPTEEREVQFSSPPKYSLESDKV